MNAKKLLVSFVMLVSALLLVSTVSAADSLVDNTVVLEVNGMNVNDNPAIVVGETVLVRIEFTASVNAQDVTVFAELSGDRRDVEAETSLFDVEDGQRYVRTIALEVPFDLDDSLSGYADLDIRISGSGYKSEISVPLRVQRESYSVNVLSATVPQTVTAGELFPVDVVLKNAGYNNLDDLFVTALIPALDVQKTSFFGDLVAVECDRGLDSVDNYGVDIDRKCNEDDEDTLSGRLFLQVPYNSAQGVYALEVLVENDDTVSSQTIQVVVENQFSDGNFIVSGNQLLIVNPTNQMVVYRLVPQSTGVVSVGVSESLVSVPAGSSRTVAIDATANAPGTYDYVVNVFSVDGDLLDTVSFSQVFDGREVTSPIVVLTVILAIIFIVLLVVLIVLLGKKPQKSEEFGESYY